jgi:uncharacterized protein
MDGRSISTVSGASVPVIPFRQFVLKVYSRCNLACNYCYVYEMNDQSWRTQPYRMSAATIQLTIKRIADHVRAHGLETVAIVLHGGEPLLAGAAFLAELASLMRSEIPAQVEVSLQTNGLLLNADAVSTLTRQAIRIGVSLDGGARANDRHRLSPNARSSHADVDRALRVLGQERYQPFYAGLLCTIDLANDPVATYEALLAYTPPALDFLLPHGTWSVPPPGIDVTGTGAPYGEWLLAVFDRWYSGQETSVRLFREILQLVLGGVGALEGLGLRPATSIVVDTDGAIKQLDSLSATYPGAAETGLNVAVNSFDETLSHPLTAVRQGGLSVLSQRCQSCPVVRTCGGGLLTHRYRDGNGFDNPSVYCRDLLLLISTISDRVRADLRATAQ